MADEHRILQQDLQVRVDGVVSQHRILQQDLQVRTSTIDEVPPTPTGQGGFVTGTHWKTFK